jgi:hypothetical protein
MIDFNKLSISDKANYCWNGQLVQTIQYYNYKISLYALGKDFDNQFAEVYVNQYDQIESIRICNHQDLRKFWTDIDLESLM